MDALRRTLRLVMERSPLYRERFATLPAFVREGLRRGLWPRVAEDLTLIPFTDPAELAGEGWRRLLCVSQDKVARMVTLHTSGTTGGRSAVEQAGIFGRRPGPHRGVFCRGHGRIGPARRYGADSVARRGAARRRGRCAHSRSGPVGGRLVKGEPVCRGVAGEPRADPAGFSAELRRWRPACLVAAPSQIRRLLDSAEVSRLAGYGEGSYTGLRAVLASSEPLPPDLREP